MSQNIAKKLLKEMALIEEAEADGNDRWNTLKGYLEGMAESAPNKSVKPIFTPCPRCGSIDGYHTVACLESKRSGLR